MRLTQIAPLNSIAYRGDTRPPEIIFRDGFWNRQTPEYQWLMVLSAQGDSILDIDLDPYEKYLRAEDVLREVKRLEKWQQKLMEDLKIPKECEPYRPGKRTYRMWVKNSPEISITLRLRTTAGLTKKLWDHYVANLPEYRKDSHDISPKTAVCFTLRAHVAPYFPIGGCLNDGGEWVWIYAAVLGAAYKTYVMQKRLGSENSRALEVAVEHVSSHHVVCAVRCWRSGRHPRMDFVLSPRICWNPKARGARMLCRNEILEALYPYQAMKTTCYKCKVTARRRSWLELFKEPTYPYYQCWQR